MQRGNYKGEVRLLQIGEKKIIRSGRAPAEKEKRTKSREKDGKGTGRILKPD